MALALREDNRYLVVNLDVGHLDDNLLELVVLPCVRRALHHRKRGVVELVVVNVQEDELGPEMSLLSRANDLGNVWTGRRSEWDSRNKFGTAY